MSDMASSTSAQQWKYGVFISFRGRDTRDNFTSHLYYALCCKHIKTFMDNDLERGEEIEPALLRTIEESRIAVVIFSKNYASSPWCLDELKKILECKRTCGQIVLPVFYHVDPSDVDEQRGAFGNAFAQLERNFKWKMDKVSGWRADLTNAANISGWDSQVTRPESKLVSEIVQFILKNLNHTSLSDSKGLVGIDSRIERLKTVLCIRSSEVRIIGIWGMGGIGKKTIAEAVFNSISSQYESCCFISNVREKSEECGGLIRLREEFLSRVLELENLRIDTPRMGSTVMKERIQHKKVLAVLDDVNDVEQVECLIERHDMFGTGSRILVTSRDRQVLKNVADEIYEVEKLNCSEARQLFSLTVFKENHIPKDYMGLSIRAVNYARGNPLALKVLGSFLFGQRKEDWENALNKLEKNPHPKIYNMLKASFDALGDEEKDIFLDIGCFFKGNQIDYVKRILDGCGFSTNVGVFFLAERCLVTISNGKLEMHDLLQEMAFEIVRQESIKELGKRSRLWSPRDVNQVLTKNLGTEKVEGIFFDTSKIKEIKLSSRAFVGMYNLRLLKIYNSEAGNNCKVYLPDGLKSLSDELRYLQWDGYPLKSLPSNFHPENLVELNLSHSKLRELWKGDLNLVNLIEVNLSNCEHLTAIPDLSKAKNLERLNLQFCTALKVVPSSVQFLEKLVDLDMKSCTSLLSFPRIIKSKYLKALNFSGCSNLKMYPEITENVTYLNLNETAIKELPQSIGHLRRLGALNLRDCKQLGNLPDSICLLTSVILVDVSGCSNVTKFPNIPKSTRYLYLSETAVEEFLSSVGHLRRISSLDLSNCGRLKNLPSTIHELACLEKLNLSGCSTITEFPNVSCNIKELYLDGTAIEEIPWSIECCYKLVELHLRNCTKFEILPGSICKLKSLEKLNLSGCSQFQTFPGVLETMPSLRYLYLDRTGIKILPTRNLTGLRILELGNCIYLEGKYLSYLQLLDLKYLRKLNLSGCGIMEVPKSIGCIILLEALDLSGNDFFKLPKDIRKLSELQYLGLRCCMRLKSLPKLPPRLAKLDAHSCTSLRRVPSSSTTVDGNIFEFIFTNCLKLGEIAHNNIMAYALLKFQLYAKRLYSEISSVAAGVSSFCIPGCKVPAWFLQQNSAASVTIQLLSGCASSELWGFVLCTVVAFEPSYDASGGFQVKCTYHFKNGHADPCILHCYFASCYGSLHKRSVKSDHLFFGYDPCLDATKDFWYGKYSEVSVEFSVEDMDNNPLQHCHVSKCGVRELYTHAESYYDFILPYRQNLRMLEQDVDPKYLRELNLSCCGILEVPKSLGRLTSLEALDLSGNNFVILPTVISELRELQYLGLRYCRRLVSLQNLPPRLANLDAHSCTSLRKVLSFFPTMVDGNIFEFIFTNCLKLGEIAHNNIMAYALLKIQLYAKRLYSEISSVAAGVSSFCFPGCQVPAWFLQQNSAASVTIQLLSGCASSELLGFVLCTVVAFEPSYDASGGFQVKCTYHFKNGHADPCILHCYFASCYGSLHERSVQSDHLFFGYDPCILHCYFASCYGSLHERSVQSDLLFFGYDPCLNATKDFWYGKYSEVSVEFSVEDMDNNPLQRCHVSKCGVRELYTQAKSYCDFILPDVEQLAAEFEKMKKKERAKNYNSACRRMIRN